jgi:hypothetical protein
MKTQQDYIHFGSSAPIVLAPYETVPVGGSPKIQVTDPDLYIRVRDILLARQLSGSQDIGGNRPPVWPGPTPEGEDEGVDCDEEHGLSFVAEGIENPELQDYVDEMLAALQANDIVQASATLIRVIACLGGERTELRAIVGIFAKILETCVKKTQASKE